MTTSQKRSLVRIASGVELSTANGLLRVSLLAEGIVRVRMSPDGAFVPRRSWDVTPPDEAFTPPAFAVEERGGEVVLTCGTLAVAVQKKDGRISFSNGAHDFAADLGPVQWEEATLANTRIGTQKGDALPEGRARKAARLTKAMAAGEHYYGFGERTGLTLERGDRVYSNWTRDPSGGHDRRDDNLYQATPYFMALRPGLAWGLLLHSTWYTQFDAGAATPGELTMLTHGGEFDYYLLYGPTPAEVVERLTRLTGRPALPPLWAMGYHQSRWSYPNEQEVEEVAREFRTRDIPLDVIHLDIDYMDEYRVFTWNPKTFPAPEKLMKTLRGMDVRAVTIVDPGVKYDLASDYPVAREGLQEDAFILNPDGTPFVGDVWPGAALFTDYAKPAGRAFWGRHLRRFLQSGVSGVWNDMNEPAVFEPAWVAEKPLPLASPQGDAGERTNHAETHNLFGYLMAHASYDSLRALRPNERPWVLTRSGFAGIQRYAAVWTGDNHSWWENLEMSLPEIANMGLCGMAHVGSDIGGFGSNSTPELFARWMALGVFYPFMRTHTCIDSARQEPWSFGPAVEAIARQYIILRYRLLPYLYTLAHRAAQTGEPLWRPLCYEFPDDTATYHIADQVMAGPHLLVAPVVRPGQTHRMVYLPEGAWYDYWTGARYEGPAHITVEAPLEHIPLFVRAGAILTLGNARASTAAPLIELTLAAWLGDGAWSWVEDDGLTFAYQDGAVAETTARLVALPNGACLHLDAREGAYQPAPRMLAVALFTGQALDPARIRVTRDGEPVADWTWDEKMHAIHLRWADDGLAHVVEVGW